MNKNLVPLFASLALLACTEKRGPAIVTLGVNIDRTGSMATQSWSSSIDLAVKDANRGLQLAGQTDLQFAVAAANSHNVPDSAVSNAIDLVRNRNARVIITDSTQDEIAQGMLAYDGDPKHDLQVPVICMACSTPLLGDPSAVDTNPIKQAALRNEKGWLFRTNTSDAYQARVDVRYLVESVERTGLKGGKFHLATWASDDPFGHAFADSLRRETLALRPGATVTMTFHPMNINIAEYDWSGEVAKALANRGTGEPDVVIELSFSKYAAAFTRAYVNAGVKTRLFHTHNFRNIRVLEPLGAIAEGQEGTSPANLNVTPAGEIFAQELKAATGIGPEFRDSMAYDAAMAAMLATVVASKGGSDVGRVTGPNLRTALHQISNKSGETVRPGAGDFARAVEIARNGKTFDYDGASGPCDFDAHGNVVAPLARFSIIKQEFVDVERFDCVRSPDCPAIAMQGSR